jgi:hypothetical protein
MSSSTTTPATTTTANVNKAVGKAKPKKNLAIHFLAGGVAGCCEALSCHPLDTIKVRLQLRGERMGKTTISNIASAAGQAAAKVSFIIKNCYYNYYCTIRLCVAFGVTVGLVWLVG